MLLDQYGNRLIAATDSGPSRGRGSGSPRNARFINNTTGMGGATDKDLGGAFYAYRMPREEAEQLYAMSWAAAKMVDIPIDDMFWRGRRFTGDDQNAIDAFEEAEHELGLMTALPNAMKAGQIFGTGLMIVCHTEASGEGKLDKPFTPDMVQEGGLANLWVVDRWGRQRPELADKPIPAPLRRGVPIPHQRSHIRQPQPAGSARCQRPER